MTSDVDGELETLGGAHLDAVELCPTSGLVAVVLEDRVLGIGIGPQAIGIGWLRRRLLGRAARTHPLVAAARAHLTGQRVDAVRLDDEGTIWIVSGESGHARLGVAPGRRGEATVIAPGGAVVLRWPSGRRPRLDADTWSVPSDHDLEVAGAALLDASDRAVRRAERLVLARSLSRRRASLSRRADAIRGDLARAADASELSRIATLLDSRASQLPRGAARVLVDDWETGGTVEVTLDPAKSAREQVEAMFTRAKRLRRGEAIAVRRLAETTDALERVLELCAELDGTPDDAPIESIVRRAREAGARSAERDHEAKGSARPTASERALERRPFHAFRATGGLVLVGRGGADNDALTTRHARPHDLWLHAKGVTGAHVVVPLERGASCPADLLVDAATLAAHFSDARGESLCEVSYVERRHVRKPRKSPPGRVVIDREKVIALRVEPARLERLLRSKQA